MFRRYSGAPNKILVYFKNVTFYINPITTFISDESGHALRSIVERDTFDHIPIIPKILVTHVQNKVH